jgi:hypothetical protein
MDDLLMELLDLAGKHAHMILLEKREPELVPIFLLFVPDGPSALIPAGWRDDEEKQILVALVKLKSREIGATAVSFVSEAWTVKVMHPRGRPGLDEAIQRVLPARENPQRIEIVNAAVTDGVRVVSRVWQMVRDKPGGKLMQLVHITDVLDGWIEDSPLLDGIIRRRPR